MAEKFMAHITKYALSRGIFEVEVTDCFDTAPAMVRAESASGHSVYYHFPEWHRTRTEANIVAEAMRLSAIRAAERRLAKLEAMKFGD